MITPRIPRIVIIIAAIGRTKRPGSEVIFMVITSRGDRKVKELA
jgi:hypothetical protein